MLLLISVTAYGQYSKSTSDIINDPYRNLQSDSFSLIQSLQTDASSTQWAHHSPTLISLLLIQLSHAKNALPHTNLTITNVGVIYSMNPTWSLSLLHIKSRWNHQFDVSKSSYQFVSSLENLPYSYFKYFIPITIQNKVIGDFYLVAKINSDNLGLLSWFNIAICIEITLLLLFIYFIYLYFFDSKFSPQSESSFKFSDMIPLINKRNFQIENDKNNFFPSLEKLISDIINKSSTAVVHFNSKGIVQFFNDPATAITGLEVDDISYWSFLDFANALGISKLHIKSILDSFALNGFLYNKAIEYSHFSTNDPRVALISGVEFSNGSNLSGYVIFVEDITEYGIIHKKIAYSDRLNLIAEFAASTAHEIRNPLTTVRGFLQLQKKREANDRHRSHYHIMIDEIDRVDQLISEYLMLARNSSFHKKETVSISALFTQLLPLITAEANLNGVEVIVNNLPDGICLGNLNELKQVFLNICKNALDAMTNGGCLSIEGANIDNTYSIIIKDNGVGINNEVLDHIFEPFFTTKEKGSGLGLSVSKRIIESHQGFIRVHSLIGKGTSFHITIPLLITQHMVE